MAIDQHEQVHASDGAPDLAGYRELATGAVVAMLLGFASPLVLFGGLLVVVPLLGIAIGLFALKSIAVDPASRSGRGLALCGIGLAAGCLAMSGVNASFTRWLLTAQARPTAEAWLEQVRVGNLESAEALSVPLGRVRSGDKVPAFRERFAAIEDLQGSENEAPLEFDRLVDFYKQRGRWQVDLSYRGQSDEGAAPYEVMLRLERLQEAPLESPRWCVKQASPPMRLSDG